MLVPFVLELAYADQGLTLGFYKASCPSAEDIVKAKTKSYISRVPSLAPSLLRLHFHDCFVRGCEGSVLLNSTSKNTAEKSAGPNLSLRGFQVIDGVKTALEKQCPGVVSCADILALVARDAVMEIGGPSWPVLTGRRDGRVSLATEVSNNLPAPFFNITQLSTIFASKGLTVKDLAVLSGAHTIGVSHCASFSPRLYNFTGKGDTDPSLDPSYVAKLKEACKPKDATTLVEMDPGSFRTFDTHFYTLVGKRRVLFNSDSALLDDHTASAYVRAQALPEGSTFFNDFGESMMNMGRIGVLTGSSGEIRKHCAFVN
ncbi:hypothetical protein RHMOL_Rhmol04G0080300 [Rhododendron molle]|uniref:Uncharacterized protein n=1 Tax=Rhododendron molle TaxID=49168 RepID=A0ACC0P0K2_RHOML|nr:hypothetical protein RHMOL_Rhmol04G0080300 [Rhododendron molle]